MRQVLVVSVLLVAACSAPPVTPPPPKPNLSATVETQVRATVAAALPTPKPRSITAAIGEDGFLYATRISDGTAVDEVPTAATSNNFVAYLKAARAHDDVGIQNLLVFRKLQMIRTGTRAKVIDTVQDLVDIAQVRFIDGDWPTGTAWLDHTWVVAQLPADFVRARPTPTP